MIVWLILEWLQREKSAAFAFMAIQLLPPKEKEGRLNKPINTIQTIHNFMKEEVYIPIHLPRSQWKLPAGSALTYNRLWVYDIA